MDSARTGHSVRRRSQRIPLAVPLLVTSLDPNIEFAEHCETVSVSSHGCRLRSPRSLGPGAMVRLDILHTDRTATARVIHSEPMGLSKTWEIAVELEKAENFWGIQFPPEDWTAGTRAKAEPSPQAPPSPGAPTTSPLRPLRRQPPQPAGAPAGAPPSASATPPAVQGPLPPSAPAPAAAPPPPGAPTQARAAAPPPSTSQAVEQFERILNEKAKTIAAQFEGSYRQSLGDLVVRIRADLEERALADWERLRRQAQRGLEDIAAQVRQQIDKELERRKQEAADTDARLSAVRQLHNEVKTELQTVGDILQQRIAREREPLLAQSRREIETMTAELRRKIEQELERRAEPTSALMGHLQEVRQARDYVESLIRLLPQNVDQRVQEGVATTLERIRERIESEFAAQREGQGEQLEQHLLGLTEQLSADLRQKLFEDFDRHQREFLDRINVRLEEVRIVEGNLHQYASRMSSNLAGKASELLAEHRTRLDEQLTRLQEELASRLHEHSQHLEQRGESALRNLGTQTWSSLRQRLQEDFDQRQHQLRQALETAGAAAAQLQTRAEKLATRLDTGLEEHLEKVLAETTARTREQIHQAAESARQSQLAALQEKLDSTLAPLVNRAEATAHDLHNTLNSLRQERAGLDRQATAFRQEIERARAEVARETQQFQKLVHDALTEASGQIRGRLHLALEMANEPMERMAREAATRLESLVADKSAELARRLEETHQRMTALQTEVEASLSAMLDSRLTYVLNRFQEQTEKLTRASATQLQATLNDALASVSRVLREKLGPSS